MASTVPERTYGFRVSFTVGRSGREGVTRKLKGSNQVANKISKIFRSVFMRCCTILTRSVYVLSPLFFTFMVVKSDLS